MSKKANPARIGLFIIGAIAMAIAAVMILGRSSFWRQTYEYVLFFEGSLNGLAPGSAVMLQGVRIGRVSRIHIDIDKEDETKYKIPVTIEISGDRLQVETDASESKASSEKYLTTLFNKGFRGRLAQQSILTGQLMVELGFFAKPAEADKQQKVEMYEGDPVIPTVASPLDSFVNDVTQLPLNQIANHILSITMSIDTFLKSKGITELPARLEEFTGQLGVVRADVRSLTHRLNDFIATLNSEAGSMSRELKTLSKSLSADATTITRDFKELAVTIRSCAAELNGLASDTRDLANPSSRQMISIKRVINELSDTTRSLRQLTDLLNRNPQALLIGKGEH